MKFEVTPIQDNRSIAIECEKRVTGRKVVKNTSGISEERFVIQTGMEIGDHRLDIELTLANRDTMEFRMLLGREAFKNSSKKPTAKTSGASW